MITQETAARIWHAHRDIEAAEKMLEDIATEERKGLAGHDRYQPTIRNAFGNRRSFQLGIPSGGDGHRLLDLKQELAKLIIESSIGDKLSELKVLNRLAAQEVALTGDDAVVAPASGLTTDKESRLTRDLDADGETEGEVE